MGNFFSSIFVLGIKIQGLTAQGSILSNSSNAAENCINVGDEGWE